MTERSMQRYRSLHLLSFRQLLLVTNFFVMSCNISSKASNITVDQSSLLALRSHITTSEPRNTLSTNWTTSTPVCSWIGITCGSRHLRVISVNLPSMALRGTIPPEIGNLSFLIYLNLRNNTLHGNMPRELSLLPRLRIIDLSGNNLLGELSPSFFNTSSLQVLSLTNNSLSGDLPDDVNGGCRLRELRLGINSFTGRIPSTLYRCSQLQLLVLSRNSLAGVMPRQIFNLTLLQELLLGFNNLTGAIPQEIGRLQNLEYLGLENNSCTGAIPSTIFNISSLRYLSLAYNDLSGSLPQGFTNLTRLQTLYLAYNNFQGTISQEISYMYGLQDLVLQFNYFSGNIPPGIFNLSNLITLSLNDNLLSWNLPTISFNLPNLERLFLGRNNLQGRILDSITNCTNLLTLEITDNQFSGSIPSSIANLARLRLLALSRNNFTRDPSSGELSFLTSLTNCRDLIFLTLNDNPLDGTLPRSIGNFSSSLRVLIAGNCMIRGEIPNEIGNLTSVELFALSVNTLSGNIPETVQGLQSVQRLFLGTNLLTGILPDSVCTLQNLGLLDLSENQLSGPIPECLGNNDSYLRELYLSQNRFESVIPNSLWNLGDLSQLDLSSNFLRGPLSPNIGNLEAVVAIDLSMNELSGSIPNSIGSLQRLINLSLAHNRFEGSIPENLNNMLSLVRLDLSQNNLTGVIPTSLESLESLNYFNVSFNDLSGEIPSRGPFVNFTDQSFVFNGDLCGEQRFNVSPCVVNSNSSSRSTRRLLIIIFASLGAVGVISVATFTIILIWFKRKNKSITVSDSPIETHRRISYYELQQATNGFNESNLLGKGGFGSVYKGVLGDGTVFAVKVFNLEIEGVLKSFDTECEVLKTIRHRNLSKIISSCSNDSFKALILDYMPNGSLERWLYTPDLFLDIMQRLNILIDVACALEYLHNGYSTPVVHCDLKPSNVLLDEDMVAHVSDFGMAKLLGVEDTSTRTSTLATIGYMAPEYGMEGVVSPTCDVYSFGIMLMEVFTRTRPSEEYFSGDFTMKSWVQNSLPNGVVNIVDAKLIGQNEQNLGGKLKCLTSIFEMSISCTAESPRDRTSIRQVLAMLKKIKLELLRCTSKRTLNQQRNNSLRILHQ